MNGRWPPQIGIALTLLGVALSLGPVATAETTDPESARALDPGAWVLKKSAIPEYEAKALDGSALHAWRLCLYWDQNNKDSRTGAEYRFWLQTAAENGNAGAQWILAIHLIREAEDVRSRRRACYWLKRAFAGGMSALPTSEEWTVCSQLWTDLPPQEGPSREGGGGQQDNEPAETRKENAQ